MYLVLVSCFSFGEGWGEKGENQNWESSRKYVHLKTRDLKHNTRLHAELHLHEKMVLKLQIYT